MVDGVDNACAVPSFRERPFQMHDKMKRAVTWQLSRPAYDEFLRIMIEVLFIEGRRIERIEKLRYISQFEFDGKGSRGCLNGRNVGLCAARHGIGPAFAPSFIHAPLCQQPVFIGLSASDSPWRLFPYLTLGIQTERSLPVFPPLVRVQRRLSTITPFTLPEAGLRTLVVGDLRQPLPLRGPRAANAARVDRRVPADGGEKVAPPG